MLIAVYIGLYARIEDTPVGDSISRLVRPAAFAPEWFVVPYTVISETLLPCMPFGLLRVSSCDCVPFI